MRCTERHRWKRKVSEAIHIQQHPNISNLDCGLQLNPVWLSIMQKTRVSQDPAHYLSCFFFPFYFLFSYHSVSYMLFYTRNLCSFLFLCLVHTLGPHALCFSIFTTPPILLYVQPFLLLFNSVVFPGLTRTADEGFRIEMFFVYVMILNYLLRKLSNSFIVIEDYVQERNVGADVWRRTGVLTFDGNTKMKQKVTFNRIKKHLDLVYNRLFSYETIVQLCAARNQRRQSSCWYKDVAHVICRQAGKGFQLKFNPDSHCNMVDLICFSTLMGGIYF